jgi:hypothetical protein
MKNEYDVKGDITSILLKRKDGTTLETTVSTQDLERLMKFDTTWYGWLNKTSKSYYVQGRLGKTKIYLHRFLTNAPKLLVVDHINHDTLDNTRPNLRLLTDAENRQNRKGASALSNCGIRGVSFDRRVNKWYARVCVNSKVRNLGYFDNIEDARIAAIEGRKKYMKYAEDAKLCSI